VVPGLYGGQVSLASIVDSRQVNLANADAPQGFLLQMDGSGKSQEGMREVAGNISGMEDRRLIQRNNGNQINRSQGVHII
jgi:hypothetical protein